MLRPLSGDPSDADALADAVSVAFGIPTREDVFRWWDLADRVNVRVWAPDGRVQGGLLDLPAGMAAGGRLVPAHGVAAVCVAPEARGRGAGTALMGAYLQELDRAGAAVATLYASTRALYAGVGYGIGGERWVGRAAFDALRGIGRRSAGWREATDTDRAEIEARHPALTAPYTGRMARNAYLWGRVWSYRGAPNRAWVLPGHGELAAWVVTRRIAPPAEGEWATLEIVEHHAVDGDALDALIAFVSGFGTMSRTLQIPGPTPIWDRLPEHRVELRLHEPWMLRVVNLRRALEGRGWPAGLSVELSLQVDDPLIRDNGGRFTVRIAGGRANVLAGGDGLARVGIAGLASLYTGHTDPWTLRARGALSAPDAQLAALSAAFSGPRPVVADFF